MVHIAFVIDPIETLNLKKDSTLAMIRAAQQREWRISILEQGDLVWDGERVIAFTRDLRLEEGFAYALDPAQASSQWFQRAEEEERGGAHDVRLQDGPDQQQWPALRLW